MAKNITELEDVNAEASVIATLLYHPEFMMHSDFLKTQHFTQKENAAIYWAISELYKQGIDHIDTLNINNMLNSHAGVKKLMAKHNLENIDKFFELSKYAARDTLEDYLQFCKTVVTLAYKRELFKSAQQIERNCLNDSLSLKEVDKGSHEVLNKLTEDFIVSEEIDTVGDLIDDVWAKICSRRTKEGTYGLPSKIKMLQNYFSFQIGEVVVVAGRMKEGKSAYMTAEALDKVKNNVPTLYIDTELSNEKWIARVISNLSQVELKKVENGNYTKEEEARIENAKDFLRKAPLVHIYMPIVDMDEVFSICRVLKYKMNLKFVIFDYLKSDVGSSNDIYNRLGDMANTLKNKIAGSLELAVLTGAQLARDGVHIADSDKIMRYCSTGLLWRYKTSQEIQADGGLKYGNVYCQVFVNRNGDFNLDDEYISVNFAGNVMTITDCEQPEKDNTPFDEKSKK